VSAYSVWPVILPSFSRTIETVRANRDEYAQAERRVREQRPRPLVYFDDVATIGGGGGDGDR
jgi:hypothetical protein